MMDESIAFLRAWWGDASVDFDGDFFTARAMAMEPKPPQRGLDPDLGRRRLPGRAATGGHTGRRLARQRRRWATAGALAGMIERVKEHAAAAGRDPSNLGFQAQLSPPPRSDDPGRPDLLQPPRRRRGGRPGGQERRASAGPTINVTGVFLGRRAQRRCDDRGARGRSTIACGRSWDRISGGRRGTPGDARTATGEADAGHRAQDDGRRGRGAVHRRQVLPLPRTAAPTRASPASASGSPAAPTPTTSATSSRRSA